MTKQLILALSGGGLRGIYTNEVLSQIEQATGYTFSVNPAAIVGSSTGGISAIALGSGLRINPAGLVGLYDREGSTIFSGSTWNSIKTLGGLTGPKYTAAGLKGVLERTLGTRRLGDATTPVAVVTYNVSSRKTGVLSSRDNPDMPMVDACLATSAAPTFFPPFGEFIDGGCTANNPTVVALDYAEEHGIPLDQLKVLSVGTGFDDGPIRAEAGWGKAQWLNPLVTIFTDGVAELATQEGRD